MDLFRDSDHGTKDDKFLSIATLQEMGYHRKWEFLDCPFKEVQLFTIFSQHLISQTLISLGTAYIKGYCLDSTLVFIYISTFVISNLEAW